MSYFKPVRSLVGEEAEKAARWERYNVSFGGLSKLLDDLTLAETIEMEGFIPIPA